MPIDSNPFGDLPVSFDIGTGFDASKNPLDVELGGPPQNPAFVMKKNGQQYEFRVALCNFSVDDVAPTPDPKGTGTPSPSGDPKHTKRFNFDGAKQINPQVITELVITENLHDWHTSGYMVVQSTLDGFERRPSDWDLDLSDVPVAYTMRMDCRDLLIISVMPLGEADQKSNSPENPFPLAQYCLRGEFVIYDTEDVFTEDLVLKAKKFYFHDLRYQLVSEQRMPFSTNDTKLFPSADPNGRINNEEFTGKILRTLLYICDDPKIGFGWGPIMQITEDKEKWDEGSSKMFFTAPANYTVLDSMNYILDRHVSKDKSDLCIFTTDRYTNDFELLPFSKLFELSTKGSLPGKYQIEHMFIPTVSQLSADIGLSRAPLLETDTTDLITDVRLANFGYLASYRFVDFSGLDNAKTIMTRPVFSYDFLAHQFVCEYKEHNIEKTKEFFKANYTDKMYGGISGKPSPLLTLNEMKKKQKVLEPVFSTKTTKESRLNDGRNRTLFAAIYLNEHIAFTTLGSTNRTAGRFIGLDKDNRLSLENDFDHRLLGQWLTTEVKHIFLQDSYINEIQAVKIQSFRDLKLNENIP